MKTNGHSGASLLKINIVVALIISAFLFFSCAGSSVPAETVSEPVKAVPVPPGGFSVDGTMLLDGFGNRLVMRGVNHAHTWYASYIARVLPAIRATGANTVRIVLSNGVRWNRTGGDEISEIIKKCRDNSLIAVLEVHDTTGFGQEPDACTIAQAAEYWVSVSDALTGEEAYAIINIGNEPYANNASAETWKNEHIAAVKMIRAAGLTHTIMADSPDWGQDGRQIMLDNAAEVLASDPLANTMFSVHMYQVYSREKKIRSYLEKSIENNLCVIVGEFGADHYGQPVDELAIMKICTELEIGYLGWSWCGNSKEVADLDITVHWNPTRLTPWGDTLINSEFGLKNTGKTSSVFTGMNN